MASRIKDWRARADWETLMVVGGLPFDRFFTVIWPSASAKKLPCCCRSDSLLKPARANTRRFRTPRTKFCECAGEKIALYLYVTHMKLFEGLVSEWVGHKFHLFLHEMRFFFCMDEMTMAA